MSVIVWLCARQQDTSKSERVFVCLSHWGSGHMYHQFLSMPFIDRQQSKLVSLLYGKTHSSTMIPDNSYNIITK